MKVKCSQTCLQEQLCYAAIIKIKILKKNNKNVQFL